MSEASLNARVVRFINRCPRAKAIKIHGTSHTRAGTPDVVGSVRGRSFAIEGKVGRGVTTARQERELLSWGDSGALTGVYRTVSEAAALLGLSDQLALRTEAGVARRQRRSTGNSLRATGGRHVG